MCLQNFRIAIVRVKETPVVWAQALACDIITQSKGFNGCLLMGAAT
jgi:hypothetical protein